MGQAQLTSIERQPAVTVGLVTGSEAVRFALRGEFAGGRGGVFAHGDYQARAAAGQIEITAAGGEHCAESPFFALRSASPESTFIIRDVTIGIDFHWQRKQDQEFQGALMLKLDADGRLTVVNEISVEEYLISVISSEMSAHSNPELLKTHSIISRSWLLAQIKPWKQRRTRPPAQEPDERSVELIRWYDQENHVDFDVCADDHCQRYQGVTKAASPIVYDAVRETAGDVLVFDGALCDARYSKSCGGMTESYDAAWEDVKIKYLAVAYDGEVFPAGFELPLTVEANAENWIRSSPPAFCNTSDATVLQKILPDFDQETSDFYRWRVTLKQTELQELLQRKLGIGFGAIHRLEPVERGESGRLIRLRIVGERRTLIIGKELEIRRALSPSHLYSSAFVVETDARSSVPPVSFTLIGAGWGHGVGLCQIGAALMAERGFNFQAILSHYYRDAKLQQLYQPAKWPR